MSNIEKLSDRLSVFGDTPVESVFFLLDTTSEPRRQSWLIEYLATILPDLNWRSHIYLLDKQGFADTGVVKKYIQRIGGYLERNGIPVIYLHPFLGWSTGGLLLLERCKEFLELTRSFQKSAYQYQSEVRLMVPPIIQTDSRTSPQQVLQLVSFLHTYCSIPSFYLSSDRYSSFAATIPGDEARFYIEDSKNKESSIVDQLWMNHIFETLIERLDDDDVRLTAPCHRHLIIDQQSGAVFSCFRGWKMGIPDIILDMSRSDIFPVGLPNTITQEYCPTCMGNALLSMQENLIANGSEREGREVFFRLALALSHRGEHGISADLSGSTFNLSLTDDERTAALIHQGLSRLELQEFELADQSLKRAGTYASDQGLVAYHRGQVQFAWRDYIEALDRYEEALGFGSEQISLFDTYYQMALCHINIEEYSDAQRYLKMGLSLQGSEKTVPVLFYLGVCDYGQGKWEDAKKYFQEALNLKPSQEDLSRVLYYFGACLKELELFEEAIQALEKACQVDPADLANFNLLGFCYYRTKQHKSAVDCFQKAVEIDPRSAIDWANLGSNLRDLGRIEEAIVMYKKALSLDPTIVFARQNLVELAHRLQKE